MATLQATTIAGNISATTLSGSGASLNSLPNASLAAGGLTDGSFAASSIGRANMNLIMMLELGSVETAVS